MADERTSPQYKLRLSAELHGRIVEAAKTSGRSMNSEIVHRLQRTFDVADRTAGIEDERTTERTAALGEMIDLITIVRDYVAKLPPETKITRRQSVELALNSYLRAQAMELGETGNLLPTAKEVGSSD